ncbi:YqaA family protein [Allohahella marinimesophila]|uniref:YqaA family protein n=1 Tax=Allohahella marinimesophila TaxID=1054972 RepID=A0ABP7P6N4_9GAMM
MYDSFTATLSSLSESLTTGSLLGDYGLLWLGAFAAATILPFYSELLLLKMLTAYPDHWLGLTLMATFGNTMGACVNWWLGKYMLHYQDRRWFPLKEKHLKPAQRWFEKYGKWTLLLSWSPLGGDAITLVAGIMKVKFWEFYCLTFAGKAVRYFAIALILPNP